jgi:NHL repeat
VKNPDEIAVDGSGNVYVLDSSNFRVLKLPRQR